MDRLMFGGLAATVILILIGGNLTIYNLWTWKKHTEMKRLSIQVNALLSTVIGLTISFGLLLRELS